MATNWRVIGQRQVDQLTAQGAFVASMEVNYETIPEGIPGQVTVELRYYTAEHVASLIDERVNAIKAVQNL